MIRARETEVVVVGAGIAGCRAAIELQQLGRQVLLVDKARFPRWKPCAGAISHKAAGLLTPSLAPLLRHPVRAAVLSHGPEVVTRIQTEQPVGWLVRRQQFDAAHLEAARSAGAGVIEGMRISGVVEHSGWVDVLSDSGVIRAAAVVGADGVEGIVARAVRSRRERRLAVTWEEESELEEPVERALLHFDFAAFAGGYGWIFTHDRHCSAGGGVFEASARQLRHSFEEFAATWPCLANRRQLRARGFRVPQGGCRDRLSTARMVLVGDSADAVDPITGEGIAHALRSAHIAVAAVDRLLGQQQSLEGYTFELWRAMHFDFAFARKLAAVLYRHPSSAFELLFRNRQLCQLFIAVLRGELGYYQLLLQVLLRLPRVLRGYESSCRATREYELR